MTQSHEGFKFSSQSGMNIGRCLQRALDHKVRKLRAMLTADEDIASELDRVVCRLMKLALRTSRVHHHPPPTKWMQCKLFDLLSLTEKALDRRRKRFIENFPLNALEYDHQNHSVDKTLGLAKIKNDDITAKRLVDKYQNLVQSYESKEIKIRNNSNFGGFDFDEDLTDTSNEVTKAYGFVNEMERIHSAVLIEQPMKGKNYERDCYNKDIEESKLQRIQAWVDDDVEVVPYPNHDVSLISSGDTDHSVTNMARHRKKMSRKRKLTLIAYPDKQEQKLRKKSLQKTSVEKTSTIKIQEKNKTSKSKIFKKDSVKKSSYSLLVKANLYKTSSNSFGKLRSKIAKEFQNVVKPIPDSFKELCHPDLNVEKKIEENMKYLTDVDRLNEFDPIEKVIETAGDRETNVSATKEELLVDIVMDGMEERIILQRSIGTDADEDHTEFEQETVLGSLLNVMRNDSFCNKSGLETENVHSQTIFLNDINEPSTSKGVRHVSMDVQCGPDVTAPARSTLSTSTSFTKLPKVLSTGIKIGDSELELQSKINSDFGTCTGDNDCHCKTITPKTKSVGIKIKDSDTNITMNTEGITKPQTNANHNMVSKETELIKAISSGLKMEDSGSECFESVASCQKSSMRFESSLGFISDTMLKSSVSKEAGVGPNYACMKYDLPKLSRGGVYVHSYKNKQESEDILYQGQWQRCRPKALAKKRVVFNIASVRRLSELTKKQKVTSKEKTLNTKSGTKEPKLEQKNLKPIQFRTPIYGLSKFKKESITKTNLTLNKEMNELKFSKYNQYGPKTVSKLTTSSLSTNKPKSNVKRPPLLLSKVPKKEPEIALRRNVKSHEAKNLKKIVSPVTKSILNKSIDSAKVAIKNTKGKPIEHKLPLDLYKTECIKKELLNFDDSPRDNISYVVLRNESDNKNDKNRNSVSPKPNGNNRKSESSNRRNLSPQSPTSSTCSSPNSIATVRLATTRSKVASNRRTSLSSNPDKIDSENVTPIRNKKYTKKHKIIKKSDLNDLDNKENIPESSNGVKKDSDAKFKNTYVASHKSVYTAQVTAETLPLQNTMNSRSRHITSTSLKESLKNSNVDEVILANNSFEIASKSSSLSSHKSLSHQGSITLFSWSTELAKIEKHRSHSLPRELNSSDKSIASSLKKLIEDRLEFIRQSTDNLSPVSIDSKTVILSNETLNNSSNDERNSPDSFKTVIHNEDLNDTFALQSDLESAVNGTFDSLADSTVNIVEVNSAVIDTDVLSFKITTATSRASEYFSADNDTDDQVTSSKVDSVRDIFERKDPLMVQSDGSNLTSQAFSGFSINAVAGDRPDPVNFIDSETGSVTLDLARQATSEEVFVSGRSSASYESCQYDEDVMLPYWLFHINDQFLDEDEEEEDDQPEAIPLPVQHPDPAFDMNGNVVAVGAGAGDGRGIHSDHSQDSSGHGTSTTSSDPSSGVQSEAILIDPLTFTGQYELPAVATPAGLPDMPLHEAGENIVEVVGADRNGRRNPVVQLLATSDMDADVSSLDTDVPDSS